MRERTSAVIARPVEKIRQKSSLFFPFPHVSGVQRRKIECGSRGQRSYIARILLRAYKREKKSKIPLDF